MQDRERFLALPHVPDTQHSINPKHPPNPPSGTGGTGGILTSSMTSGSGTLKVCCSIYLRIDENQFHFINKNQQAAETNFSR